MNRLALLKRRARDERGTTLLEVVVASGILLMVTAGLMGLSGVALQTTENQGHLSARETEYAVDKMEQLLELTYGDVQSDTTVFPSVAIGGTGLAVGGSSNTAAPVVGYTDYMDQSGNVLCTAVTPCNGAAPANWYYIRVWQVATPSPNLKQITVTSAVRAATGGASLRPSTVSAFKTNCPTGC